MQKCAKKNKIKHDVTAERFPMQPLLAAPFTSVKVVLFFSPGGGHTVPDIPSSAHLTAAGAQGSEACCKFDRQ